MIYALLSFISSDTSISIFRLMKYVTTRSIMAFVMAFVLSIIFGRRLIRWLYKNGYRDTVRDYGVIAIDDKKGTPTMGGILIIFTSMLSAITWCDLSSSFIQILLFCGLWFGFLGGIDDRAKIQYKDSDKGLSRTAKYTAQSLYGLFLGVIIYLPKTTPLPLVMTTQLYIPFYKYPLIDIGFLYIFFVVFMIVYCANAINFADGLDGLAIVPTIFVLCVYGIFAYLFGNVLYSSYLLFDYIPGAGEIAIFASALTGASVGFLWFNTYPAEVFMGDTGSIYLGGLIGTIVVLLKQEVLFFLAGGIFTAEIISVVIQDWIGIQRVGRRFLYRAPIHHTFQYRGWSEPKITTRFWIIAGLLAVLSLATLKIR